MPHSEIRTTFLLAGLVSWLAAGALYLLQDFHKPLRDATQCMATALAYSPASIMMSAVRDADTSTFALWFGLHSSAVCFTFLLEAVRQFRGFSPSLRSCVIAILLQGFALAIAPDSKSIILLYFGFQIVYLLLMLSVMLSSKPAVVRPGRIVMMVLIGAYAIGSAVRWFEAMYSDEITLLSPTLNPEHMSGLLAILYVLSPVAIMIHVLVILNSRQLGEVTHAASTDELTGLLSRRFLLSNATKWRETVERQSNSCALLLIDADNFKAVNDRFGHEMGDDVVRHLARTLSANLRAGAILARYVGQEFCALVRIEQPGEAHAAAERLRLAVESAPYRKGLTQLNLTISVGVAMHGGIDGLSDVLRVADRRVYKAKERGRNCVITDEALREPESACSALA